MMSSVASRLGEIHRAIDAACARADRAPGSVRLLAVSKQQPDELVLEAYGAGVRDFSENYVQELAGRRARLGVRMPEARWHLIGHLQSNKSNTALEHADVFHALDSERLAEGLARRARALGRAKPWPVYLEVNVDLEPAKHGVKPGAELDALVRVVRDHPAELRLEGIMCIPEPKAPPTAMRPAFARLAELGGTLGAPGLPPLRLSMGMSDDFEVAVEEGAHWVRIGRKLFGDRPRKR